MSSKKSEKSLPTPPAPDVVADLLLRIEMLEERDKNNRDKNTSNDRLLAEAMETIEAFKKEKSDSRGTNNKGPVFAGRDPETSRAGNSIVIGTAPPKLPDLGDISQPVLPDSESVQKWLASAETALITFNQQYPETLFEPETI